MTHPRLCITSQVYIYSISFTQNIKHFILQAASFCYFEPTAGLSKHKDTQDVFLYLYSGVRPDVGLNSRN